IISAGAELMIHHYVRNTAHFSEYAILALLTARACVLSHMNRKLLVHAVAVGLVLLIASLDELNQSFEPSRTGSAWDVMLDLSGGRVMPPFLWLTAPPRPATSANERSKSRNFVWKFNVQEPYRAESS